MKVKKHKEITNYMGSLLKSLVILSVLHGFLTTSTTYALSSNVNGYGDDTNEIYIKEPEIKFGFLNGFHFGLPIAHRQTPPENIEDEGSSTESLGSWEIHSENAGVSAMHIQLMPNNKAVWHDSTSNGLSEIENNPRFCRPRVGGRKTDPQQDCTAHAIEYDIETAQVRPLKVRILHSFNFDFLVN